MDWLLGAGAVAGIIAAIVIAGPPVRKWWTGLKWPQNLAAWWRRRRLKRTIRRAVLDILVEYEGSLFKVLNEPPSWGTLQSAHERVNQQLAEVRKDVRSNQWLLFNRRPPLVFFADLPIPDVPEYEPWARLHVPWVTTYEGFLSVVTQFEGLFVYGWRLRRAHALWKLKHRRGMVDRKP